MIGASWYIRLLGGLSAERDGHPLLRFQTRKTGGLLAYLAYHMPAPQARDLLVDQFWPSLDVDGGRSCLATSLTSLRRQLEPPDVPAGSVIVATRLDVRLNASAVSTDVQEFRALSDAVSTHPSDDALIRAGAEAVSLYRGNLLPGCYEDWVEAERDRLAATFVRLAARTVQALERSDDSERALEFALAAAAAAPDQEAAHRDVIRLYRTLGRDLEAVRQYRMLEERLRDQWGHAPSSATQMLLDGLGMDRLAQRRLRRRSQQARSSSCAPAGPASRPTALAPQGQAAPRAQPMPPCAAHAQNVAPSQPLHAQSVPAAAAAILPLSIPPLPTPITHFFGRESEIEYIGRALALADGHPEEAAAHSRSRLVSITGPAGSGKTRLAVEIARRTVTEFDGAAFVPLSGVTDGIHFDEAMLAAIGVSPAPGTPHRDLAIRALSGRRSLLVVDNAEHLGPAVAEAAQSLLESLPDLHFLVTSRIPLGIQGERLVPLAPLPVPQHASSPERLMEYACVRMFVDRAQAVSPDFQITLRNAPAIAAVCAKLEGIPLAIELAAARVSALTPQQMLTELEERFRFLVSSRRTVEDRHKTLSAALQWSYDLLPAETQRFLNRITIFRGGWTLEGARAVWPDGQEDALFHLERLVEQAMVSAADTDCGKRFGMLESVREFSSRRLDNEDRITAEQLFTEHMISLAESECPRLRSPEASEAVQKLQPELANFRIVLGVQEGTPESLRLATALWRLWTVTGNAEEGASWLRGALDADPGTSPALRCAALTGLGTLHRYLRDYTSAMTAVRESLQLGREIGDDVAQADSLNLLAVLTDEQGDAVSARVMLEECLAIRRRLGDTWNVSGALNNLGRIAHRAGDLATARRCYTESQDLYKILNDWSSAAVVLSNLGVLADETHNYTAARAAYEESLMLFRELGKRNEMGTLLYNLGEAMFRECDHPEAARHLHESIRVLMEQGDRASIALPLAALGSIAARRGDAVRAVRLHAAADTVSEKWGAVLNSNGGALYAREVSEVRAALLSEDFEAAWRLGKSLTLEQAVSYAIAEPVQVFAQPRDPETPVYRQQDAAGVAPGMTAGLAAASVPAGAGC